MARAVNTELRALWLQRFEQQACSQLSVAQFCQQQQLNVNSFYSWKRKLHPKPSEPPPQEPNKLIPIRILQSPSVPELATVRFRSGVTLSLPTQAIGDCIDQILRTEHALQGGASC